jgi:hypothetical protein
MDEFGRRLFSMENDIKIVTERDTFGRIKNELC